MIFNKIINAPIMLNPDQFICPRCKGEGFHPNYDTDDGETYILIDCTVCDGDGYVDWARYPLIGDWESEDIEFEKECAEDKFEEEYWKEIDDQYSGSFNVDE